MGYNKIPLALRYNDTTNNAEGLIEFQLNLSDVGDVCGGEPGTGQALVYHADGEWCPSTLPAPGAFNGNLSDVGQVCDNQPTEGQALVWSGSVWCPSTIPTGGGGGGDPLPTATNAGDIILADGPGTAYSASAPSDAGIMQLDPYFTADDEGKTAVWDGSQLTVEYPDRLFIRVEAGEPLTKGDLVYVSEAGPNNNTVRVMKAQANSAATMPAIGMVFSGLNTNQTGTVISFGKSSPVNVGTVAIGTTVYVDPDTPGAFTTTKPTTTATDLIQNIGFVAASGSNGVVKLTGVGRSNDIPNNLDVFGSATIGTNEFTQTTAKLANVDANHILISTAASATSSVASATLFGNYYTKSEVYTQAQANAAFLEDAAGSVDADNLNSGLVDGDLIKKSGTSFASVDINAGAETFLGTAANFANLNDADLNGVIDGDIIQFRGTDAGVYSGVTLQEAQTYSNSLTLGALNNVESIADSGADIGTYVLATTGTEYSAINLPHSDLTLLDADDHTQYVLSAGTREMATLTVTGATNFSGTLNVQPSGYNQLSGCPLPVVFQKQNGYPIASSNSTTFNTGTSSYGEEVFSSVIPANTLLNYDIEIVLRGRVGLAGQTNYRMATTLNGRMSIYMSGGQVNNANDGRYEKTYKISRLESNRQLIYVTYRQGLPGASWITQGYGGGYGTINGISYDGIVHNETLAPDTSDITFSVLFSQNTTSGYMTVDSAVVTFIPNA